MRLRVRRIAVWRVNGSYRLQAATELAVSRLLEGREQAVIVFGEWNLRGRVLGFYQSSHGLGDVIARRSTGGGSILVERPVSYASVIFPSTSLNATVDLAREISGCLGTGFAGATRLGPKPLSAGVIEYLGDFDMDQVIDCSRIIGRRPRLVEETPEGDKLTRISRAYAERRWIRYDGASTLPMVGEARRDHYMVRVGVRLYEGRFIAEARIDGDFLAAPPAEPFSTIAGVQGMPVSDQVLLALETRFSAGMELYGIEPEDIVTAFRYAVGDLNDE